MDSLTSYIKKAFEYKDCGDYKSAIDYFYKALAIENNSSEILKELASLYATLCQYDRAISLYEQINIKCPENYAAKFEFAILQKKLKNISKAKELLLQLFENKYELNSVAEELFAILLDEKQYEKIISLFMVSKEKIESALSLYFIGVAYSNLDFPQKAEEYFNKSFSLSENNVDAGYNIAKILFEKSLFQDAEALLNKLLQYSEDDRLFYLLAEISYSSKNYDQAINYYSYAIKLNPQEAEYYYKLGVIYSLKGFVSEAEQCFCKSTTIDGENIVYNYTLAYLYYTTNKISLSEKLVDYILTLDNQNISALSLKCLILLKNNEVVLAKKIVEKISELNSNDDFSYYAQSVYYSKLNLWDKAIKLLEKAIEKNSFSIEYKFELAMNFFVTHQYEKSMKICDEILLSNDKYINAYILMAKLYVELNDYKKAIENIDKASKLDINSPEIYMLKGIINYKLNDYKKALENYKIAVSITPDDDVVYFWIAKCYYCLENYNDAYSYFKEASDINILNPEYRYYMFKCSINKKDTENVISNFLVLKRLEPKNIEHAKEYASYMYLNGNKKIAVNTLKNLARTISSSEIKEDIKKIIKDYKKSS